MPTHLADAHVDGQLGQVHAERRELPLLLPRRALRPPQRAHVLEHADGGVHRGGVRRLGGLPQEGAAGRGQPVGPHLEAELLEGRALQLGYRELVHHRLVRVAGEEPEAHAGGHAARAPHALLGRGAAAPGGDERAAPAPPAAGELHLLDEAAVDDVGHVVDLVGWVLGGVVRFVCAH